MMQTCVGLRNPRLWYCQSLNHQFLLDRIGEPLRILYLKYIFYIWMNLGCCHRSGQSPTNCVVPLTWLVTEGLQVFSSNEWSAPWGSTLESSPLILDWLTSMRSRSRSLEFWLWTVLRVCACPKAALAMARWREHTASWEEGKRGGMLAHSSQVSTSVGGTVATDIWTDNWSAHKDGFDSICTLCYWAVHDMVKCASWPAWVEFGRAVGNLWTHRLSPRCACSHVLMFSGRR